MGLFLHVDEVDDDDPAEVAQAQLARDFAARDEMRAKYDFSKAERGKFHRPLEKVYRVHVHQNDGTTMINNYSLAEGTVLLAPDVREYFSDSEAVNEALRSLIHLMEKVPARRYGRSGSSSRQVAEKQSGTRRDRQPADHCHGPAHRRHGRLPQLTGGKPAPAGKRFEKIFCYQVDEPVKENRKTIL